MQWLRSGMGRFSGGMGAKREPDRINDRVPFCDYGLTESLSTAQLMGHRIYQGLLSARLCKLG